MFLKGPEISVPRTGVPGSVIGSSTYWLTTDTNTGNRTTKVYRNHSKRYVMRRFTEV